MSKSKIVFLIVILLLLISNGYFAVYYYQSEQKMKSIASEQQLNEKTINFTKLFISKVLKATGEIDFETRLELENAVRNLDNAEILVQWNGFVNSQVEDEAQNRAKDLLELLVNEI